MLIGCDDDVLSLVCVGRLPTQLDLYLGGGCGTIYQDVL